MSTPSSLPGPLAESRSKIYWLLSRLYLDPMVPPFLEEVGAWLDQDAGTDPGEGLSELYQALRDRGQEGFIEALQREHARLFAGIERDYGPPPPFESLYRQARVMGEVTVDVLRHYQEAGYGTIYAEAGPQDHIGVELRFLSLLCYREAKAWEQGMVEPACESRDRQWRFLEHHPLAWVPGYCDDLRREAREPYFAAIAGLTAQILRQDRAVLGELMEASAA